MFKLKTPLKILLHALLYQVMPQVWPHRARPAKTGKLHICQNLVSHKFLQVIQESKSVILEL